MNNIRIMRERSGKTQEEVASALNLDRSTVAKWESSHSNPRFEILTKLADTLGCTLDDLIVREAE